MVEHWLFFQSPVLRMSSLLESEATFKAKALSSGLTEGEVNGVNSLSRLAFVLTTPGITPDEVSLRRLINSGDPDSVCLGTLSAIRRLVFEAQKLSIAMVKSAVEGTDVAGKVELAPAERSHRIAAQKTRCQESVLLDRMNARMHLMTLLVICWKKIQSFIPNRISLEQGPARFRERNHLVNL